MSIMHKNETDHVQLKIAEYITDKVIDDIKSKIDLSDIDELQYRQFLIEFFIAKDNERCLNK